MSGVAEDELNHNVDRRRSLGRWVTCTLGGERMDTKDGVPQPVAATDEKGEKSVKGQTESPKIPLQRSRGERSVQRSVRKQKDIFLTFGADLKTTRGSVLKNRPPILARSKIRHNNGEWSRLRRKKLQKGAKKDKGRESIGVLCGTDGLCKQFTPEQPGFGNRAKQRRGLPCESQWTFDARANKSEV